MIIKVPKIITEEFKGKTFKYTDRYLQYIQYIFTKMLDYKYGAGNPNDVKYLHINFRINNNKRTINNMANPIISLLHKTKFINQYTIDDIILTKEISDNKEEVIEVTLIYNDEENNEIPRKN